MWNRDEQTICAISTPHGVGGISVIRVSGKQALEFTSQIAPTLNNKKIESHRNYFAPIVDKDKNKVDEAIIAFFAEKRSFTGDETVEISCHGSPYIVQKILDTLISVGCRLADRGEFTYRAFMNGRLDLLQAESVLGLIESQNQASARLALRQLDGHVSTHIEGLISELIWCLAHIEAGIDFSEQGVEVVDTSVLIDKLNKVKINLEKLVSSYQSGRLIKDGVKVVLMGEPNVGKSSLLNLLLRQERAIVTPLAGTTRDTVEGEAIYNGVKYSFIDTAGLRETQDQIEIIGIEKSKEAADSADVLCFVFNCADENWTNAIRLAEQQAGPNKIYLLNKADLVSTEAREAALQKLGPGMQTIYTSALEPTSRDRIFQTIQTAFGNFEHTSDAIISSSRQLEQISYSVEMTSSSLADLQNKLGSEFVAMHLKEALISLQKTVGHVYDDQILDRVFKEFCLGK